MSRLRVVRQRPLGTGLAAAVLLVVVMIGAATAAAGGRTEARYPAASEAVPAAVEQGADVQTTEAQSVDVQPSEAAKPTCPPFGFSDTPERDRPSQDAPIADCVAVPIFEGGPVKKQAVPLPEEARGD